MRAILIQFFINETLKSFPGFTSSNSHIYASFVGESFIDDGSKEGVNGMCQLLTTNSKMGRSY